MSKTVYRVCRVYGVNGVALQRLMSATKTLFIHDIP